MATVNISYFTSVSVNTIHVKQGTLWSLLPAVAEIIKDIKHMKVS